MSRPAISSWTNSTRAAEQRWPALSKAEARTSRTACSGSAEESTIIALMPPVSAMSAGMAPSRAASARLMRSAVSFEPVKATPPMRGSASRILPILAPSPGKKLQNLGGTPALMQKPRGEIGDERRLLGGLGDDRIAGSKRCRHLAGEDRERESSTG